MVGTKGKGSGLRDARLSGLLNACALLALVPVLVLVVGCPFLNPVVTPDCTVDADCTADGLTLCFVDADDSANNACVACLANSDCDDDAFCNGAETCVENACVAGTDECDADTEICDEDADNCRTVCGDDLDCDDGDFCTGAETCDADGACANGAGPCAADETCDEETETCIPPVVGCETDDDCDDTDPCTTDTCVDTECDFSETCPDDGDFCNGTESCDADTGDCSSSGDPCADEVDNTRCDEATDACVAPCTLDTDCDDAAFCNGTETCDVATGACVAGTDPCADDQTCDEDTDACTGGVPVAFDLTPGNDTFTGGSADDTFDASQDIEFGQLLITLNNGDVLDGGLGTDTLNVQFNATVTPQSLAGIEVFNVELLGGAAQTFNFLNADSVTTINNNNPSAALTVNNIATAPTNFGITNNVFNYIATVDDQALTGTADACTLSLSGVTLGAAGAPDITIQPDAAGGGYETITVDSMGSIDNAIDSLVDGLGTSFATLNVTGTKKFTVTTTLGNTVTTCNGANGSGGFALLFGTNTLTCTGTSGNDTIDLSGAAGDYTTTDTIDGGGGDDELRLDDADADVTVAQTNVTNIGTLRVNTTADTGFPINASHFGATKLKVVQVTSATSFTVPTGGTFECVNAADNTANITVLPVANTTADTLNLVLGESTTANIDLSSWETVNLETKTEAITVAGTLALNNAAGTQTLTVTGNQSLVFTGVVTADEINASALGAGIFLNLGLGVASTVTGSAFADAVIGSTGGDIISGGDGNDFIRGVAGGDSMTGGSGADQFQYGAVNEGGAANIGTTAGADVLTDFTPGTGGDLLSFDDAVFGLTGAAAATIDFQTVTSAANGTTGVGLATPGVNTEFAVVVNTTTLDNFAAVKTFIDTTVDAVFDNAANDDVIVIVNVTGIGQIIVYDPNIGTADDQSVFGAFSPTITLASLLAGNFSIF